MQRLSLGFQDGSYSYCEFSRTFEEYDIQRVMRAYENSITVNVHCCDEGEWTQDRINAEQFSEFCQVSKSKWNEHLVMQLLNRKDIPVVKAYFGLSR